MGPIQSLEDLISMLKRHLPIIVTVMALGMLLSLYLAVTSPRTFEAVAVIQVEAPAIIDPESDAGIPSARRVQLIEQRLMVRSNLIAMIDRHQLYGNLHGLSLNEKVALLRQSTRIESVAATGRDGATGSSLAALIIVVQAETAEKAAALANDFASSIINQDELNRESRAQEALAFLRREEERVQRETDAFDRQIAQYHMENEDSLPASQDFIQTESTQLAQQLASVEREIMSLERERLSVQAADMSSDSRPTGSLAQQLRTAELELAQARRTFSPDHPEIARLENNIRQLFQGGVSEPMRAVSQQVELIEAQLEQLREQIAVLERRQAEIERARARVPDVMREVEAMTREQQRLRDRYAEVSRRLAEVEMLQSLQESNQTERFVVLEDAVPPEYPALSGRKKSALLGGFVSIAAALGIAFLLELRRPVLRNVDQFTRVTGIRPVISLRYNPGDEDRDAARRRNIYLGFVIFWGGIAALWLIGYLPGVPSPGVVGPMGSG